jgi:hypothetical protein
MQLASPGTQSRALSTRPLLEALEQRRLLSASLDNGVLTISGTDAADDIEIHLQIDDPGTLVVEEGDVQQTFALADVTKIVADGGAGDDRIRIDDRFGTIAVPVQFSGGAGTDELRGGAGADLLDGGAGDDNLRGGGGADTLLGGSGSDTLRGGAADDSLSGGRGRDRMLGQAGDDSLLGARGDDTLLGGQGDDRLEGGRGRDHVVGGLGADFRAGRAFGSPDDNGDEFDDDSSDHPRGDGSLDGQDSVAGGGGSDDQGGHGTDDVLPDDRGGHGTDDPVGHT